MKSKKSYQKIKGEKDLEKEQLKNECEKEPTLYVKQNRERKKRKNQYVTMDNRLFPTLFEHIYSSR